MGNLYKQFATDPERERNGITVEYHDDEDPNAPPQRFKVARSGGANVEYNKAIERLTKPYRRALAAGTVPLVTVKKLQTQAFVETCMLGWENVTGPDNRPISFSKEAAQKLMDDLPDLCEDLQAQANTANLFKLSLEGDVKN